jgi:hypothetical protein
MYKRDPGLLLAAVDGAIRRGDMEAANRFQAIANVLGFVEIR